MKLLLLICAASMTPATCQDGPGGYLARLELPGVARDAGVLGCQRAGADASAAVATLAEKLGPETWPKVYCSAGPRADGGMG